MSTFIHYARHRHFCKRHGWGKTWVSWLWLDAILFAIARAVTLYSPRFARWCREIDRWFFENHDWPRSITQDTGYDCWIDAYWRGSSPEDAALDEVDAWEE